MQYPAYLNTCALIYGKRLERCGPRTGGNILVPNTSEVAFLALLHWDDEVQLLLIRRYREGDIRKCVRQIDGSREDAVIDRDQCGVLVTVKVLECGTGRLEDWGDRDYVNNRCEG